MFRDRDPALGRFERDAACVWVALIVVAAAAGGGRIDMPVGVMGGGVLAALSYLAIKGGATALVDAVAASAAGSRPPPEYPGGSGDAGGDPRRVERPPLPDGRRAIEPQDERRRRRRRSLIIVLKFLGRCALLALVAYGMLNRLRLHPLGLLVGVSAPVLAVPIQLVYRPDTHSPGKSG